MDHWVVWIDTTSRCQKRLSSQHEGGKDEAAGAKQAQHERGEDELAGANSGEDDIFRRLLDPIDEDPTVLILDDDDVGFETHGDGDSLEFDSLREGFAKRLLL